MPELKLTRLRPQTAHHKVDGMAGIPRVHILSPDYILSSIVTLMVYNHNHVTFRRNVTDRFELLLCLSVTTIEILLYWLRCAAI
jgi:hypothetical protein